MILSKEELLPELYRISGSGKIFFLVDSRILSMPMVNKILEGDGIREFKITGEEKNKNVTTLVGIWKFLSDNDATRKDLIVNVGGGVISDIGGFAAATFKRGMRYVNIPTTLLSAIDASIGGKTGIDFLGFKNQIGAFHRPEESVVVVEFLDSLPHAEILSGYGEMLKCSFLDSPELVSAMMDLDPSVGSLVPFIQQIREIKLGIVERDPFDYGERKCLNLGHTAGHALESLFLSKGRPVPHGIAVAYGLLVSLVLSHIREKFDTAFVYKLSEVLKGKFPKLEISCRDYPALLDIMRRDKKNGIDGEFRFVILRSPGTCLTDISIRPDEIIGALDICRDLLSI